MLRTMWTNLTGRLRLVGENALLAAETMRSRAMRSFLTVLGVFIGVVIIIGVASVLNGFRQRTVENFESMGANNLFITREPAIRFGRSSAEVRQREHLRLSDVRAIEDLCPSVEAVSPIKDMAGGWLTARAGEREVIGPFVNGAWSSIQRIFGNPLIEGRFLTGEEVRRRARVCVVGHDLAQTLFPGRSAVGQWVSIHKRRLRIIGVYDKFLDQPFGGENPKDSMILVGYPLYMEMFPWDRDMTVAVAARSGRLDPAIDEITEILRIRRRVAWADPNDFEINTSTSLIETFDRIVFATLAVMFAMSTVAFLVGGIGVMNVMFASVKERTREIGVRRAIGARRTDIKWQFLIETATLTGAGGLLGVVVGEVAMRTLALLAPSLPVAIPMWARLFGFFGSVGVGLVFGLIPAIQAARLDPIRALRYE